MKPILASLGFAIACGLATAQSFPWPSSAWRLVDSNGALFGQQINSKDVFLRLPADYPNGYYYFDLLGFQFESLSQLPPADRVFLAQSNLSGGFTLTRPSNSLPVLTLPGTDVMPVSPYNSPSGPNLLPEQQCKHKVILTYLGATFDPLVTGYPGIGSPQDTRVYNFFQVVGQDRVSGTVWNDLLPNGTREANEPGIEGLTVRLYQGGNQIGQVVTGQDGSFVFTGVGFGDYSVELALDQGTYQPTTPLLVSVSASGCCEQVVGFGAYASSQTCEGRTPGFWRNNNGLRIIQNGSGPTNPNFWDELDALNLVNAQGLPFDPGTVATNQTQAWRSYLQGASATNMAYMLSAHLAAMQLNVLSGGVSLTCRVRVGGDLVSIAQLMEMANLSLLAFPYTPNNDPSLATARADQARLKDALDAANNNQNWN